MSTSKEPIPNGMLFLFAGISGMLASCVVHPLNMVKNRMQVHGLQGKSPSMTAMFPDIIKNEGIRGGLYKGLSANLLRQSLYTTARLGSYTTLLNAMKNPDNTPPDFSMKIIFGMVAGAIGALLSSPADLVLIRATTDGVLPPDKRLHYTHVGNGLLRIAKEEGVRALWRGAVLAMIRASVLNGTQLATYSQIKEIMLATNKFEDDVFVYVTASTIAVIATAFTAMPVDVIKTRVQYMKTVSGAKHKGSIDLTGKLIRKEGVLALWKGSVPFLVRSVPHTIITFVVFEKLQNAYMNFL